MGDKMQETRDMGGGGQQKRVSWRQGSRREGAGARKHEEDLRQGSRRGSWGR